MASGTAESQSLLISALAKQQQQQQQQQQPQHQQQALRRILPSGPAPRELQLDGRKILGSVTAQTRVPPKNVHVKAACDACRKRKIKCSGERPKCNSCRRSGAECKYISAPAETHLQALKRKFDEISEEKTVYQEFCELIRSMPETESFEIVRRLRADGDIAKIVRQVKDGCLLLQLALTPESRLRYAFPYVSEMPPQLRLAGNPYLESPVYEATFLADPSTTQDELASRYQCAYLKPYHAAQIIDPRISGAKASNWTAVIDDDELFRKLLHCFFLFEYTTYPHFHKDMFLDDLAEGKSPSRFCSSLMVNTILAIGCHLHRALPDRRQFWKPQSLGYKFLAEARRLWELERQYGEVTLTTAISGVLLNVEYNHNSMDKLGQKFLAESVSMANELRIFDREATERIPSRKMRTAREFFAWGLFNWTVIQGFYFYRKPMTQPPVMSLPDPDKDSSWYGEFWLQFPLSQTLFPSYHGHTVRAISGLRSILSEIACFAFHDGQTTGTLSWEEAMGFKKKLDEWLKDLPTPLTPKKVVFPWHLKTHMEYHAAIHRIFTTLLAPGALPVPRDIHMKMSPSQTVDRIIEKALVGIETLLRLYYLRHSFVFPDGFLIYHLSLLTKATKSHLEALYNPTMNARPDPMLARTLRSTIFLCIKGLNDQGQHIYIGVTIYRVLRDELSQHDLGMLRANVPLFESGEEDAFLAQQCHSQFPMPPMKANDNPRETELDNIVERYTKILLSDRGSSGSSRGESPEP